MEANLQVLPHERVPLAALRDFSTLFVTYATEYEPLAAFYAGDYRDPAVRRERAVRAAAHPRDRATLVAVLQEQHERWGLDAATQKHIEALRDPESVALVTGQQVGLLGGPLFTLYKALTVGKLARELANELDRPVVPVFWLAGEDHDYEEVASVTVLQGTEPVTLRLERPDPDYAGPVGRLPLPETIRTLLDELADLLPPTEFQEPLLALLQETYRPGVSLQDAFARLLKRLVPEEVGLVLIDPDDARLKALARPLFERELTDWETAHVRLEAVSRELAARYHVQVQTRPLNLFLLEDHRRIPLDAEPDGFHLRGEGRVLSQTEALQLLQEAPERFSPNALLRPLYQDWLLPTLAYVAGPAEVAYWAQLKPLYEWVGLPMPLVYPRALMLLVEPRIARWLERYQLRPEALQEEPDRLFHRLVKEQLDGELEAAFEEARQQLRALGVRLRPLVERVDPSLGPATEAWATGLEHELDRFWARVLKAGKRREETLRHQLMRARNSLFPNGVLQERVLSPVYFLNKYGPELPRRLQQVLSTDTSALQVVYLQ